MDFLRMRTRILTCATMEGECIWYIVKLNFFCSPCITESFEGFLLCREYSNFRGGSRGVRKPKGFIESGLCNILGEILSKHHLLNDLIPHRVRYKHVV